MNDDNKKTSLEELDASIKQAKERLDDNKPSSKRSSSSSLGSRICIELFAGIAVGCFIGYYLDDWLKTKPLFFIICFFLGCAGSGVNIYRMIARDIKQSNQAPENTNKP
tara:strand:- start:504 stop:830 length:327 start_codon:yes stop_codon:yes gene_type:complete